MERSHRRKPRYAPRDGAVYVVVVDDVTLEKVADKYVESDRLHAWLDATAPAHTHCEVYTAAPVSGGRLLETLRRDADGRWVRAR
jgi:hypothetical protein